ncbi:MAG: hypothetical protein AABX93_01730 [Nanoarchaeota archaeon]
MNQKRFNITIVLAILVVILLAVVIYAFAIKPAMNGYVINAQNTGIQYAINAILLQIQEKGYAEIPVGNQTLILVPYQNPQQQTGIVG